MQSGEKIKLVRKRSGLTQQDLADRIGVTTAMIGQWERGGRVPSAKTIERLSGALNVPADELRSDDVYESFSSPLDFELAWLKNGGGARLGSDTGREALALHRFQQLNEAGQRNALDLIELVTRVPEYRA